MEYRAVVCSLGSQRAPRAPILEINHSHPPPRATEAEGEPEGRAGEPRSQHEAGEDVEGPGATDGVQAHVFPAGPEPGVRGPGLPGGGRGQAGAVRLAPPPIMIHYYYIYVRLSFRFASDSS